MKARYSNKIIRKLLIRLYSIKKVTNGGPATSTLEVTHARVVDQVADGEEGADQVEAHPPAGQGVVGLTDVAVPDVAGGVVRRGSGFPAVCDQNEQTEQQAENGQYDDVV